MAELILKIIPDLSEMKKQMKELGVISVVGGGGGSRGGGAVAPAVIENEEQTGVLRDISKGVFEGNAALEVVKVIMDGMAPILKPILALIKILVLLIFLPLLPFLKPAMKALAGFIKFFATTMKGPGGDVAGITIPIEANIGAAIGASIGTAFGPAGTVIGAFLGMIIGGILGMLAIATGQFIAEIIKWVASWDWNAIIKSMVDSFIGLLSAGAGLVTGILTYLATLDWDKIVTDVIAFFGTAIGKAGDIGELIFGALPEEIQTAWTKITNAVEWVNTTLFGTDGEGGLWGQIINALTWVKDIMFAEDTGLWALIVSALEDAKIKVIDVFNAIVTELGSILSSIQAALNFIQFWKPPAQTDVSIKEEGDFLMRPGQAPVSFSGSDTIIGFKSRAAGIGAAFGGGGITYAPTYNLPLDVEGTRLKRMLEEHDRDFLRKLRAQGTAGGRTFNV